MAFLQWRFLCAGQHGRYSRLAALSARLRQRRSVPLVLATAAVLCGPAIAEGPSQFFVVHVVDDSTGRGVPLVELCTTSEVCYWTDSNGVAAVNEPEFDGKQVFFSVASDGYEFRQKIFDDAGTTLKVQPGGQATLTLKRVNLAERLYRVTGEGIYRDSVLAGLPVPEGGDDLRGQATGMDTVMFTTYHGKLFWLFGDTSRLSAPLGNFSSTCAQSDLGSSALSPEQALNLDFYTAQDGFVKPMVDIPGPGPKWMGALMAVRGSSDQEEMYARYDRVNGLVSVYDSGIAVFDDATSTFRAVKSTGPSPKYFASGRATPVMADNQRYFYFSGLDTVTPSVRVRALAADILDPAKYERFRCDREACEWKTGTVPTAPLFFDIETGSPVNGKVLSLAWNKFRQRWIATISAALGEVWYAEADTPEGPWSYTRPITGRARFGRSIRREDGASTSWEHTPRPLIGIRKRRHVMSTTNCFMAFPLMLLVSRCPRRVTRLEGWRGYSPVTSFLPCISGRKSIMWWILLIRMGISCRITIARLCLIAMPGP